MHISVQISLYPLKQERLSPAIETAWEIFEKSQLEIVKGAMSTLVSGEAEVVFAAVKEVFLKTAEMGPVSMVATFSNACPV
jgi:uncharacterized protein YqgV (UPF0045/DUF77 family)